MSRRIRAALLSVGLAASGCSGFAPVVEEPLRVGTLDDLAPEALGLRPGATTVEAARASLASRGLTGVASASFARASGGSVEVLGADYQSRLHVFRNGRYESSLALSTGGLPPYGLALGLGEAGEGDVLLVLYRDPLARAEEPPVLLAYRIAGTTYELMASTSFDSVVRENGGMTSPLFVGSDLTEGVMLVARDRDGSLWDRSYLVRFDGGRIALEPRPITEALRCSCVRAYAMGTAYR